MENVNLKNEPAISSNGMLAEVKSKNAMAETTFNERLKKIDADYGTAKKALYIEFAKSNEIYKTGDIISDSVKTILIDRITAHKSFGFPEPVYNGVELRKDLTPKKSGERGAIYGNRQTKLVKGA